MLEVEDDDGPMVYCAVEKQSHHRTVEDLLKKAEPVPPPDDAPVKEKMAFRLKTQAGRTVYKKRKETVEPVFGIIKTILPRLNSTPAGQIDSLIPGAKQRSQ